ncbi:hypothetical protein Tco_1279608, partial [Tanacetum coccineum]
ISSTKVIKRTLEEFSGISGLKPNMQKSTIFFKGINVMEQNNILKIIPFSVGKFPMKYLGAPLITRQLSVSECKPLIEKVEKKFFDWKNRALTYAGRLQLIASVLSSMQLYWASVSLIPKTVINEINKLLKSNSNPMWKTHLGMRDKIRDHIWVEIGNGKSTLVWYNNWHSMGPLCSVVTKRDVYDARMTDKCTVEEAIARGSWIWPSEWVDKFPMLKNYRVSNIKELESDVTKWKDNNGRLVDFSVKQAWKDRNAEGMRVNWKDMVWNSRLFGGTKRNEEALSLELKILSD